MKKTDLNNTKESPLTLEELLDEMKPRGRYSHLRIVLSNNNTHKAELGETYLYISSEGFTLCQLYDIEYHDDKLWIELKDFSTDIIVRISIDVNDNCPNTFFIPWMDVLQLMREDHRLQAIGDELLELDEEISID